MTSSQFASRWRSAINRLLEARADLKALREQDGAVALANNGVGLAGAITDTDLTGTNADLTEADFAASITAMDALESMLTDFATTPPTPKAALQHLLKLRS